jgi:uroporphyrinogen-III synthase
MPVVLTRPAAEAQRWAARLAERGIDAIVLPLLAIGPSPDPSALQHALAAIDRYAAVMFVSANAVQGFFSLARAGLGPARAWAPGPATREALLAAGVAPAQIDAPATDAAQFDSESLWQQVRGQLRAGDRLLLVRGADAQGRSQGREWLGQQLAAAGVVVDTVVAYTRGLPAWREAERALAQRAAGDGSLWLFSSSEAAGHLPVLLPGQDWSRARALATHPRIAQAVRALGFGAVRETRPAFEEVVASIESAG